jgi:hypothetical protein
LHIEYELTPADMVAAGMRWSDRSLIVRRRTILNRVIIGSIFIALPVVAALITQKTSFLVFVLPLAVLASTMIWFLLPLAYRDSRRRFYRQHYQSKDGRLAIGSRRLEISDRGLFVVSPETETLVRWHAVSGLTVANNRCFVAVPGGELVVPLRDLADDQRQGLLQELVRHCDAASDITSADYR